MRQYLLFMMCCLSAMLLSCSTQNGTQNPPEAEASANMDSPATAVPSGNLTPVVKTASEWKEELTPEEYYILREKGTERSFTGDLWDHKGKGVYTCAGCQLPLFHSDTKFKSGTGWPSYWEPIKEGHVAEESDRSHGMVRTEVLCGRCGGHLGHVFEDGPKPTGLRYCINSAALDFEGE